MAKKSPHDTPAMRQFKTFKEQHPDCVLFFRMGDFYELFYDDAVLASKELGINLTQRTKGIPMAGVPFHSVDGYLRRMIQAGHRVAICDQVEDPATAKGIVKREVTRVVTPGTVIDESMLDEAQENPLAAISFPSKDMVAIAYAELSLGEFQVALLDPANVRDELARVNPREVIYAESDSGRDPELIAELQSALACALTPRPGWHFRMTDATETLHQQFGVTTLSGFGLEDDDPTIAPAGAIIAYLKETQKTEGGSLPHIQPPKRYEQSNHLIIDQVSLRSLEITQTLRSNDVAGSLVGTLQGCKTAMGKRLLRHWMCYPARDRFTIETRQTVVAAIAADERTAGELIDLLRNVQDVQRIGSRVAIGRCTPRDLTCLGNSIDNMENWNAILAGTPAFSYYHRKLTGILPTLQELGNHLRAACVESPPSHLRDGGLIRDGYDVELDEYRGLQRDSNTWLAKYQTALVNSTDIPSLKVGYNKVFGYYIEITHAHVSKVPAEFTRKQTLKNAERYITPELKEYEDKVLSAEQKAVAREQLIFNELQSSVAACLAELKTFAEFVAELDVVACFAERAVKYNYIRPIMVDEPVLDIEEGRHPVLDELLADKFVPNDSHLGRGDDEVLPETLALITGPNMAGKSTYIRQNALLTLMAHTGSFIPAKSATIGMTDRIFTRIGASDELHAGQSTFMVEMTETANICHHATESSLVILDEIGRGTSTLDGLALAWAIAERLASRRCRAFFATHYHELTTLADRFANIVNLNVTVREWGEEIVFLHRIGRGAADKSYGIHVARIAGLPVPVVDRAKQLMNELEVHTGQIDASALSEVPAPVPVAPPDGQFSLFVEYVEHPIVTKLRNLDVNALTPLAAFDALRQLSEELLREN